MWCPLKKDVLAQSVRNTENLIAASTVTVVNDKQLSHRRIHVCQQPYESPAQTRVCRKNAAASTSKPCWSETLPQFPYLTPHHLCV